ncbi:MAG: hypothetical protein JWN14_2548 [Chthonomonadales bacterium]|nr:hypothetical protein [Chthonomonadales bacterium]
MKNLQHMNKPGMGLLAAVGIATLIGAPYYVSAQKGRPVPGRIQTLTPYFLLKGEISAVDGSQVIVKTADYGPGLSNASGIHSHAITSGKSYLVDLSKALFQATDGTGVTKQALVVGDKVVMLVNSTPGPQQQVGNATMPRFTVNEVIRNDQTP